MPVILHLGVNDIPYGNQAPAPKKVAKARKGKANKPRKPKGESQQVMSTGAVAEILEEHYGLFTEFAERYAQNIADAFAHSASGALEAVMAGTPVNDPYATATTEIQRGLVLFLELEEMNGAPGVPTKAALAGVNHRLKHPYAKSNPPRKSFVDTGTLQTNLRAWTD